MSKKILILITICLCAISFLVIAISGDKYTESFDLAQFGMDDISYEAEDYHVVAETPGIVEISNIRIEGEQLKFDISSLKKGKTSLEIGRQEEGRQVLESVYVHVFGIITVNTFFGKCTASVMIPLSVLIILVLLYIDRFKKFRIEVRENAYSYRNTMNFGLIVFMTFLILYMVMILLDFGGIDYSIKSVLSSAEFFASFAFPAAFIVSLLVSLSNLNLMRKEGANWRNMLGFILGVGICFMTILPDLTYGFIMRTQVVDIFNEKAIATHVYSFLEHSLFFIVVYLECILLGAIVFGIRSAKNIPSFDKDYILILGSQIRPDGTLTPLLKSRADRAIEFSEMQKKESGKDICFVPSGGKGGDEVIAEAEAIGNYLREKGIAEDNILIENQSLNTYENIRNSMALINDDFSKRNGGDEEGEPKVAFSTTNYHVFRAGLLASEQGYRMEGIGSPTKRYFWVNAFIREFIATLVSERKRHLKVVAALLLGVVVLVGINYVSVLM